jgi:hypothetical protein
MLAAVLLLSYFSITVFGASRTASLTHYTSYPECCKGNANYDPKADTDECVKYSGCKYAGDFASIEHQTLEWVQNNNIIAFYDNSDSTGKNFDKNYGNKKIRLTKGGKSFIATIVDTCGNKDCDNCCATNSKPSGFLVDVEYYTALRNFGSADAAEGTIQWELVDGDAGSVPPPATPTPPTPSKSTKSKTPKATPPPPATPATPAAKCSWAGHCKGAKCTSNDDCSDSLFCSNKKCTDGAASATETAAVDETTDSADSDVSTEESVPGWGIALLVLATLMVLVLLVVIAVLVSKSQKVETF